MTSKKLTTGRFSTREELVEKILFLYYTTSCSMDQIAKNAKVSSTTVNTIIKCNIGYSREGSNGS